MLAPLGHLAWLCFLGATADPHGRVVSVQLQHPYGDTERLERYVEISPGDDYDPASIRRAIRLLYATGELSDVIVHDEERDGGHALSFAVQPAPRLLAIRVEGDQVFSSKQIARVTSLRRDDLLWRARLDRAARDVALALVEKGYLEARVRAEALAGPDGATASFHLEAGPIVRVSTVATSAPGLAAGPLGQLTALGRPAPGSVFRRSVTAKAAEQMRLTLAHLGYWRSKVEPREVYDPSSTRMALEFVAEIGPRLSIRIEGAEIPGRLHGSVESSLVDHAARPDALAETIDALEDHFRDDGYRRVSVTSREEEDSSGIVIVYEIQRGPRSTVASVMVASSEAGLEDHVPMELSTRAPLLDVLLDRGAEEIRRELHRRGYPGATVDVEASEDGGMVPVTFRATEGSQVRIGQLVVVGLVEAVAVPDLGLEVGALYRSRDVARARDILLTSYVDEGYLHAELTPSIEFDETGREAVVSLHLTAGPRTTVDRIIIAGLDMTRENVVRREMLLEEGGPLGPQRVVETQRRLSALGIFSHVAIHEMDPESIHERSLVVSVAEAPRTVLSYGAGYSERDLVRASVEVTRRNLFGKGRSATAFARIGFRGSRFLVTFREPYFLGKKRELFITFFGEEEDREGFDFERFGGLAQGVGNLGSSRWSLIGRYSYRKTRSFNIDEGIDVDREFQNSTFSGPSASLLLDTRDDPLEPHRGVFLALDTQYSISRLGGDPYAKGFFQVATYKALPARILLALSGRLGLSATYGADVPVQLPLPERFYAGGAYSLRGFEIDGVDQNGGNAVLLGGAELRVPVAGSISAGLFADAGNTFPVVSDLDVANLRYAAGIGLRYSSPFGPLRVDWGYKLNRRGDESRYRLHFAIGHAF
jgi:outer membrane protein insertion porin family